MTTEGELPDIVELLPCPFCEGRAEIERRGTAKQSCIIACEDCGCRLETGEIWSMGERWNTRATPPGSPLEMGEYLDVEVTPEMIEVGAKMLDDLLWKHDPFGDRPAVAYLKQIAPEIYRAMAAASSEVNAAPASAVREALEEVAKAARNLPRETPSSGGASTPHTFTLEAWQVWDNDRALKALDRALASKGTADESTKSIG